MVRGRSTPVAAVLSLDAPRSSGSARVAVVQATEDGCRDDRPVAVFDFPRLRRIPLERHVAPRLVVVGHVLPQHAPQVTFAERDDVIEALAADAADDALDERILLGVDDPVPPDTT